MQSGRMASCLTRLPIYARHPSQRQPLSRIRGLVLRMSDMNLFADFEIRLKNALETIDIVKEKRSEVDFNRVTVEPPRDQSHGDVATNAAMVLAKPLGTNPRALADIIATTMRNDPDVSEEDFAALVRSIHGETGEEL